MNCAIVFGAYEHVYHSLPFLLLESCPQCFYFFSHITYRQKIELRISKHIQANNLKSCLGLACILHCTINITNIIWKFLEADLEQAEKIGDLRKASRIESQLEAEILHGALDIQSNINDQAKAKTMIRQLSETFRRNKRVVNSMTSMVPPVRLF